MAKDNLDKFINGQGKNKGRKINERYASFDFCYSYFYSFYKRNNIKDISNKDNLEKSCLHLGFYLASWGMMRGSSFLLEKSIRYFKELVETISKADKKLWKIDLDDYCEENINTLIDFKNKIKESLGEENKPSDTLITKIMLGIFGNVPAYDQYFKKFLKRNDMCQTFNETSLEQIKDFYLKNEQYFKSNKNRIKTFDFITGKETEILYPKAKLIDMYGFIDGQINN